MTKVANEIGTAVPLLMRDMATYFIQFRAVNRSSLYDKLIEALDGRELLSSSGFSTLNYDCILEFALLESGFTIDYFGKTEGRSLPVMKLHGSCNMFSAGIQAGPGISYQGVIFEGGIQAWLDANQVIRHCLAETALAPVMCQYMEGKPSSVSPSAIRDIQAQWCTRVLASEKIVCIGVRIHLGDEHIWGPLAKARGTLFFIGDREPFDTWSTTCRKAQSTFLAPRFSSGFNRLLAALEKP